jgi:hypothetical protein
MRDLRSSRVTRTGIHSIRLNPVVGKTDISEEYVRYVGHPAPSLISYEYF